MCVILEAIFADIVGIYKFHQSLFRRIRLLVFGQVPRLTLPNEIFLDIINFLPNNDITDLMLLSRSFNALVTPRLKKIDMSTMNQSIKSFIPSPAPGPTDNEWISQLNLKRFEPRDPEAQKRMKEMFKNHGVIQNCLNNIEDLHVRSTQLPILKERMSLERFDDPTFLRILGALIARPKFRQEFNVSISFTFQIKFCYYKLSQLHIYPNVSFVDVIRIFQFYDYNFGSIV